MLCRTFKQLAEDTWEKIDLSKFAKFQLKEETFTDQNLLELKIKHPKEIHTKVFTKRQESINGADWEWWLTDGADWVGFRVQAKIINIESDRFEHLHYQGKNSAPQCTNLILQAAVKGEIPRVPIYCLYLATSAFKEDELSSDTLFYGCSIMSAFDVDRLRPHTNSITSLRTFLIPWHRLVCKDAATSLLEHMSVFFEVHLQQEILDARFYVTSKPPEYVLAALRGGNVEFENDYGKPDLAGVMVIDLSHTEQNRTK